MPYEIDESTVISNRELSISKCICVSKNINTRQCEYCNQTAHHCSDCNAQLSQCGCCGEQSAQQSGEQDVEEGFVQEPENMEILTMETSATLSEDGMFEERPDVLPHASKTSVLTTKDQNVQTLATGFNLDTETTPTVRNNTMTPKPGPFANSVHVDSQATGEEAQIEANRECITQSDSFCDSYSMNAVRTLREEQVRVLKRENVELTANISKCTQDRATERVAEIETHQNCDLTQICESIPSHQSQQRDELSSEHHVSLDEGCPMEMESDACGELNELPISDIESEHKHWKDRFQVFEHARIIKKANEKIQSSCYDLEHAKQLFSADQENSEAEIVEKSQHVEETLEKPQECNGGQKSCHSFEFDDAMINCGI